MIDDYKMHEEIALLCIEKENKSHVNEINIALLGIVRLMFVWFLLCRF
jgi:hypothetical protein